MKSILEEEYKNSHTMILGVLIFNNHGMIRLSQFYVNRTEEEQGMIIRQIHRALEKRSKDACNFLEAVEGLDEGTRVIYKHFATLYFVFWVDNNESELGTLDLIQVLVEVLDKCFENVCELDVIFNSPKVHEILNEIIIGGLIMEVNKDRIISSYEQKFKLINSNSKGPARKSLSSAINKLRV